MKKIAKKIGMLLLACSVLWTMAGGTCIQALGAQPADVEVETDAPVISDGANSLWPGGPEITSPCAIVMEASTGTVLYERNADEQHYPASITKILTTLLAIENCPLSDIVTFSADAVYKNEGDSSHIARDLGEEMTLEQCLYGIMLESANECAYAVAEHVGGGDYQKFIDMMNEKVAELGCTNTHFTNANGLPDVNHLTSCRDMALIAQAAIQNESFRKICGTVRYTIPPTNKHSEETPLNNHHQMISPYKGRQNLYEYCIGGKTGYTVAAGSTLVTYAEKNGMLLICVVMNNPNVTHFQDTRILFDYCFDNFTWYNVRQNEQRMDTGNEMSDILFAQTEPFAELDPDASIILPVSADFNDTQTEVSYDHASNNVVGSLVYSYGGVTVGRADVKTTGVQIAGYVFDQQVDTIAASSQSSLQLPKAIQELLDQGKALLKKVVELVKSNLILLIMAAVILVLIILLIVLSSVSAARRKARRRQGYDKRYKMIQDNRKHYKKKKK